MVQRVRLRIVNAAMGALLGAIATSIFWQIRTESRSSDEAAVRLASHVLILQSMRDQPPTSVRHLLINLADADTMLFMKLSSVWIPDASQKLNQRTFAQYASLRASFAELKTRPTYILESEWDGYEKSNQQIQAFLDHYACTARQGNINDINGSRVVSYNKEARTLRIWDGKCQQPITQEVFSP